MRFKNNGFSTLELLILIAVTIVLASVVFYEAKAVWQNNRNTDRKNNIVELQEPVDTYQAQTGKYPSSAQVNDASFRTKNLKTMTTGIMRDPKWQPSNNFCSLGGAPILQNSSTPAIGCYGYLPTPSGCDNNHVDCTGYLLSASLEGGGKFVKQSVF